MYEPCNNAEFIYSYFSAKYCMQDFVCPGTQACFENIEREEGDPIYAVAGHIRLDNAAYRVKLSIEQKTLRVTADIYPMRALSLTEGARFRAALPELNRSLPLGYSVGLTGNYPFISVLIHAERTMCGEEEMTAKLRVALSASTERFGRFYG